MSVCVRVCVHTCTLEVRGEDKRKGRKKVDSVIFELSHIKEATEGAVARLCWMKATAPGDLCGGTTSFGRINRHEE